MGNVSQTWTALPKLPFGIKDCGRSPILINQYDIILSPVKDNHIYKLNTKLQSCSKHSFADYNNIEYHAICASNDYQTLFLLDGYKNKILLVIDLNTMKVTKRINDIIWTGSYPMISTDLYNNEIIHIVGGDVNKKHFSINIENGKINIIHEFNTNKSLDGGALVNIESKNICLLIHGAIPIHSFDLKTRKWRNLNVNIPTIKWFGYIKTYDDKYVVLFGGYNFNTFEDSYDIIMYDIEQNKCNISKIKSPKSYMINTIMTGDGNIHLFAEDKQYKMTVNNIFGIQKESKKEKKAIKRQCEEKIQKQQEKSMNIVKEWLTSTVGLGQYVDNFINDGYDDMITITEGLNDQDLIDIGIGKKGHRKKIMIFIEKYKNQKNNNEVLNGQIEGINNCNTLQNDNNVIVGPNIQDTFK